MRLYTLFFIAISLKSFSQNIQKLEENNGFRGIKLGSEITNYPFAINADSNYELFTVPLNNIRYNFSNDLNYVVDLNNKNFGSLDNAKILGLYLGVFKGKIREILVVTEFHPYTLELLKLAFGEPNGFGSQWSGKNIYCHYNTSYNEGKKPDYSSIRFTDKSIDKQFDIEKEAKLKADKELEQKRAISKF